MKLFNEKSYQIHKEHLDRNIDENLLYNWKEKDNVDYWRHKNMYDNLLPLIKSYPEASWLTVGDGRYGTDANYLISNGAKNVLATDISETLLKIAKDDNFISDYKIENAESLTFEDNSFDFVLCKEAYHHFPRPSIALYEMLRVAKIGIILIEPQDKNIVFSTGGFLLKIIQSLCNIIILKVKGIDNYENFESVGNYIFTTSEREMNKIATALNLKYTFFKKQNDCYFEGTEVEKLAEKGPIYTKTIKRLRYLDLLCKVGLSQFGLLTTIIMKENPNNAALNYLISSKYDCYKLPKNPYL